MHYIRFLKVPRLVATGNGQKTINAKITITTDLGESFLRADLTVLVSLEGPGDEKGIRYMWEGVKGMRGLEVSVAVPRRHAGTVKMVVGPSKAKLEILGMCWI